MVLSAYVHIPFCVKKCKYCSFVSFENLEKRKGYIYSLLKEIDYYYNGEPLKTLYIGGGTPSVLPMDELIKIINKFNFASDYELTLEVNPNDITEEYAIRLSESGVNRVSMGAQTFDENILKDIGRRHNPKDVINSVSLLKKYGFDNISIDLIYGLPNQSVEGFKNDLLKVFQLDVNHISLYGLKIDKGSYFYTNRPLNLPDDDIQADMYLVANSLTKEYGFNHYEISNYAKDTYQSKHNVNYWKCGEYYGFGLSAHGYENGIRYYNTSNLTEYMQNPLSRDEGKFLTFNEKLEEKIFLGFRLEEGIDVEEINKLFNIDFDNKYCDVLNKYLLSGHIIKTSKGYRLSNDKESNGFLLSNIILSEFIVGV